MNNIAVCPICGKKTWLRIQDGGYLNEYPIRVNCMNCRALIKGTYVMVPHAEIRGLQLINATIEECDMDNSSYSVKNADYVAEISGELPCENVRKYEGSIPTSPFLKAVDYLDDIQGRIVRLSYFANNMWEWKKRKSTAFQLLDEGSIDFIAAALSDKMGNYSYKCDNNLKSLHCLQEVVLEETTYLFLSPNQDQALVRLTTELAKIDKNQLHRLVEAMGGIQGVILAYRKTVEVFSNFMAIYPNLLPAETYLRYKDNANPNIGIATCSFSDIKTFYQDAYESLLALIYVPVCLDNINLRGDYQSFLASVNGILKQKRFVDLSNDFYRYQILDNGMKLMNLTDTEPLQRMVGMPANRFLRNGIGHNNIKYDGVTQRITVYDLKDHNIVKLETRLMDMAVDCIGLAKSAVVISEILLFILRFEFRTENIYSIIHPRFYKNAEVNGKCPCGSNIKYKKCCRNEVEEISRKISRT